MDLSLNEEFSIHLDDRNDIATVSGRDAFEQSVALLLTDLMYRNVLGEKKNLKEKLRLQVTRTVQRHEFVDRVRDIKIQESSTEPNTYEVEIFYESGDTSTIIADN